MHSSFLSKVLSTTSKQPKKESASHYLGGLKYLSAWVPRMMLLTLLFRPTNSKETCSAASEDCGGKSGPSDLMQLLRTPGYELPVFERSKGHTFGAINFQEFRLDDVQPYGLSEEDVDRWNSLVPVLNGYKRGFFSLYDLDVMSVTMGMRPACFISGSDRIAFAKSLLTHSKVAQSVAIIDSPELGYSTLINLKQAGEVLDCEPTKAAIELKLGSYTTEKSESLIFGKLSGISLPNNRLYYHYQVSTDTLVSHSEKIQKAFRLSFARFDIEAFRVASKQLFRDLTVDQEKPLTQDQSKGIFNFLTAANYIKKIDGGPTSGVLNTDALHRDFKNGKLKEAYNRLRPEVSYDILEKTFDIYFAKEMEPSRSLKGNSGLNFARICYTTCHEFLEYDEVLRLAGFETDMQMGRQGR